MDFRVIIAGCRDFNNYELLKTKCNYFLQNKKKSHNVIILSGHASGADSLGEQYATEMKFLLEKYPANWKKHGRAAGPIRNAQMASVANALIAFWDGQSRGTKSMIELAKDKGLQVAVVIYKR